MRKYKKIIILIIILILNYVIYLSYDIYSYGNINEVTKADAAIVLGAGIWGDQPSPVFKERINHGIWLYKHGYVNKLIFTGGKGKHERISESRVAKSYAIMNSIPSKDILIEERSTITQENISFAAQIVKENNYSSVIMVSDPLHMKRAMLMAEDYGLKAYSSPTKTTRYQTIRSKTLFLAREVFFYVGYEIARLF